MIVVIKDQHPPSTHFSDFYFQADHITTTSKQDAWTALLEHNFGFSFIQEDYNSSAPRPFHDVSQSTAGEDNSFASEEHSQLKH